jgi:predicted nucleic acid-binding protein
MEKKLIDTNIFIDIFRGNIKYHHKLTKLSGYINDIIYIELIQGGQLKKSELREIKHYIRPFIRIHISQQISITAVSLVEQYGASHGLTLADAFIAATALTRGLPLLTLNRKDFRFINGLQLDLP